MEQRNLLLLRKFGIDVWHNRNRSNLVFRQLRQWIKSPDTLHLLIKKLYPVRPFIPIRKNINNAPTYRELPRLIHKVYLLKTKLHQHLDDKIKINIFMHLNFNPALVQNRRRDHLLEQGLRISNDNFPCRLRCRNLVDHLRALQDIAVAQLFEIHRPFKRIRQEMHRFLIKNTGKIILKIGSLFLIIQNNHMINRMRHVSPANDKGQLRPRKPINVDTGRAIFRELCCQFRGSWMVTIQFEEVLQVVQKLFNF